MDIDIRKAFDTISWDFIRKMLEGQRFPREMINWIMVCISSPKFSISLNGTLHGYFEGKIGLRQVDPLSPYLFILGMEFLSRRLELLKKDMLFKYHPMCGKLKISHLIFADDLLLFAKEDLYSIQKLHHCVKDFSDATDLEANLDKYSIYFGGVDDSAKIEIKNFLGFSEGVLPFKYLGVPLFCKRLTYVDCNPFLDKISNHFHKWSRHSNLPYAGRLQVVKLIDEKCRKFLWGKSENSFKTPLVSWDKDKVCCGKKQGGLGVSSDVNWNLASAMRSICLKWIGKLVLGPYFWIGITPDREGRDSKKKVRRMALAAAVYRLWEERNGRCFQQRLKSIDQLVKVIKMDIFTICLNNPISAEHRDWLIYL
ncbi:uncharacterized protein LOC109846950 [Asparagus officinalis]|uniref:uncharacterized protein LOC109846950 n=1 Tax=Asparagus officinalis TaxID=4686 RepID=UPI00098E7167|nr:uncharacterized protein LOC109846950 [Asparagus officinalis]